VNECDEEFHEYAQPPNEKGELLPPGRKLLPILVCNDGALSAKAASVTE